MQTYREYRPTAFDCSGLGLDERQDWLVGPVGTNRDADTLARSNWVVVTEDLDKTDPEGNDHETHRFGHWACGWFELVLIRPGSKAHETAAEWECALADYPVASEDHYSDLEHTEVIEYWSSLQPSERAEYLRQAGYSGRAWRAASPPDRVYDHLRETL